jgi:hypothetical protein
MTAEIVDRLGAVIARGGGRPDVFAKIGDSITVNPGFLGCFARNEAVSLGPHEALAETVRFFSQTPASGSTLSWERPSKAARIGWSTFGAIGTAGYSPLREEIRAVRPALAIVMMGTNEVYAGGVRNYRFNLRRMIQAVLGEGVVPIVSTLPPRADSPALDAIVVEMNHVVREVAESEQVPFVDYGAELRALPHKGVGPDGIHPVASTHPETRELVPCSLDARSLESGLNVRNLVTLEALDRARRFLFKGETPEG